jgi:hypothetical protein
MSDVNVVAKMPTLPTPSGKRGCFSSPYFDGVDVGNDVGNSPAYTHRVLDGVGKGVCGMSNPNTAYTPQCIGNTIVSSTGVGSVGKILPKFIREDDLLFDKQAET